jgi:hypothetical protein
MFSSCLEQGPEAQWFWVLRTFNIYFLHGSEFVKLKLRSLHTGAGQQDCNFMDNCAKDSSWNALWAYSARVPIVTACPESDRVTRISRFVS